MLGRVDALTDERSGIESSSAGGGVTLLAPLQSVIDSLRPYYGAASDEGWGACGVRMRAEMAGAQGWRDCFHIRDGCLIMVSDVRRDLAYTEQYLGGGQIKFHFRLDGDSMITSEHGRETELNPLSFGFLVQPMASAKRESPRPVSHERSVTLICDPAFLDGIIDSPSSSLPQPIRSLLRHGDPDFHCSSLPMRSVLHRIVAEILDPPFGGAMRAMYMEAKTLELLCLALGALADDSETSVPLRPRDVRKVQDICVLLEERFADPPTIQELVRQFVWNETQLMQCFRRVTGMTIFDYRQNYRMERSMQLLKGSRISVTEVAFEMGYEHPSNFATAFRRHFGISPKAARGLT
ncbi:AraC family transcriptional regulator [Rhizorhabdus wittichii DC-6]|uniref:Transcriptional regulator, AraC family n=1 Tax=Rhizorhabdus wittichii (strain DSM 6014 / CCUG 31198 / JCM 15750 / NBRC 105917 / EY 4224 / RW1) TaxID=392499 RepID=A0A9J9HAC8_RHIWR|nr:transcriptional regulator, AraC family [Rhizorhabdus wittichii RW1]ARR55205.1 AraC family transcriptional regulator [Rhizorhabdus wittichii DC-6]